MKKKEAKLGTLVKIIGDSSYHGYKIGSIYRLGTVHSADPSYYYLVNKDNAQQHFGGNVVMLSDLTVMATSLDDLNTQLAESKADTADLQAKVDWMTVAQVTEFDEIQFKVYKVLQQLETSTSLTEKSAAIAKLING